MKKINKALTAIFAFLLVNALILYFALPQVFSQKIKVYNGSTVTWSKPSYDSTKKTVIIVADNEGTEMFDLMAPFYLFNATAKTNVYVVSEKKAPVLLFNSLFIMPHYSFAEIDSLLIYPDIIVIPNLTVHLHTPPKRTTVNWIKKQYDGNNIILSICDGSATAAATGLYDGKPITTHASDFKTLQKQFPKANWVRNISVTQSGNLYSTAGVSNAVEGSLTVIKRVFGDQIMQSVLHHVAYPHDEVKLAHKSEAVGKGTVIRIASKMLFKKNYRIGVMLSDSLNEFQLASVLDTYVRTFPKSINSFSVGEKHITSKYGLALYPTGNFKKDALNEVHVFNTASFTQAEQDVFKNANIIKYSDTGTLYAIDLCLKRIARLYGNKFKDCVKLTLDYN